MSSSEARATRHSFNSLMGEPGSVLTVNSSVVHGKKVSLGSRAAMMYADVVILDGKLIKYREGPPGLDVSGMLGIWGKEFFSETPIKSS